MLAGDFQRKIKRLNKHLRIFCGDSETRPALLYFSKYDMGLNEEETDFIEICGVDKNYLPEDPMTDGKGHIVKGGWRRAMKILIARKLVDKKKAEKLFNTSFDREAMTPIDRDSDPILRAIASAEQTNFERNAGRAQQLLQNGHSAEDAYTVAKRTYTKDDMMDIGRMIHKQKNRG